MSRKFQTGDFKKSSNPQPVCGFLLCDGGTYPREPYSGLHRFFTENYPHLIVDADNFRTPLRPEVHIGDQANPNMSTIEYTFIKC